MSIKKFEVDYETYEDLDSLLSLAKSNVHRLERVMSSVATAIEDQETCNKALADILARNS